MTVVDTIDIVDRAPRVPVHDAAGIGGPGVLILFDSVGAVAYVETSDDMAAIEWFSDPIARAITGANGWTVAAIHLPRFRDRARLFADVMTTHRPPLNTGRP